MSADFEPTVTMAHLVSDEGKRMAAAHELARAVGGVRRWIAVRLSDGGTDGAVYDTRADAVAHQLHERQCYYCHVQPGTMTAREATAIIAAVRQIYATGKVDLSSPETPRVVMPVRDHVARAAYGDAIHDYMRAMSRGGLQ